MASERPSAEAMERADAVLEPYRPLAHSGSAGGAELRDALAHAIDTAVRAEREACAAECRTKSAIIGGAFECARRIRARHSEGGEHG